MLWTEDIVFTKINARLSSLASLKSIFDGQVEGDPSHASNLWCFKKLQACGTFTWSPGVSQNGVPTKSDGWLMVGSGFLHADEPSWLRLNRSVPMGFSQVGSTPLGTALFWVDHLKKQVLMTQIRGLSLPEFGFSQTISKTGFEAFHSLSFGFRGVVGFPT